MIRWSVTLLEGFNNIKFGMTRNEVRASLGNPVREFKKSKFSSSVTDAYEGCHVYYDADGRCEAAEFFEGSEVEVAGKQVFPASADELLAAPYHFVSEEEGFYISKEESIGFAVEDGRVESILFGVKSYYV